MNHDDSDVTGTQVWPVSEVPLGAPVDTPSEGALRAVLADREAELLEVKGPCRNASCSLHCAHRGPCNTAKGR